MSSGAPFVVDPPGQVADLAGDLGLAHRAGRDLPVGACPFAVGLRGDLQALLAQDPTGRLGRVALGSQFVDERDDQRLLGSSSPRRKSRPTQDLVVLLEPADPGFELLDLGQLLAGRTLAVAAVDLGLLGRFTTSTASSSCRTTGRPPSASPQASNQATALPTSRPDAGADSRSHRPPRGQPAVHDRVESIDALRARPRRFCGPGWLRYLTTSPSAVYECSARKVRPKRALRRFMKVAAHFTNHLTAGQSLFS